MFYLIMETGFFRCLVQSFLWHDTPALFSVPLQQFRHTMHNLDTCSRRNNPVNRQIASGQIQRKPFDIQSYIFRFLIHGLCKNTIRKLKPAIPDNQLRKIDHLCKTGGYRFVFN